MVVTTMSFNLGKLGLRRKLKLKIILLATSTTMYYIKLYKIHALFYQLQR